MTKLHRPLIGILLALPSLLLVGACGIGQGDDGGGDSATTGEPASAQAEDGPKSAGSGRGSSSSDSGATALESRKSAEAARPASTEPMARAVISTGQVTMTATSIGRAGSEVLRLATSWGGTIADEQTTSDHRGRIVDSTLTLRVPTPKFSEAMIALSRLGEVTEQSRKSEDVTTQVIDNKARIRAAERSIRQIERLLSRARDLGDILSIESDLARRQADLDSLKSQQAWLEDQTSQSTINVYISRPAPADAEEREARGFLAGLDDGWSALEGATVVALTILGALLPFAVVAALVGAPAWLVVRRRRGVAPAPTAEA
ncbi:MAG TPA: DUF4349 domain-containing protein [Nocardioides sp.]|uniref:DUF4349 domain-containing protein n=1 Tax=Nocardioides sp. TaxID=35761 RepID=UPI002D80C2FA|nr:DUF4349 domain-containing protein [Nocardioides sp.]HET6651962.1 DUF4349 domain-containing protein [Nocardioides sp.]